MAKVVISPLKPKKSGGKSSVESVLVVGKGGKRLTVYKVSANSSTFSEDLSYAFRKNVEKARQEHRQRVGSVDRGPARG